MYTLLAILLKCEFWIIKTKYFSFKDYLAALGHQGGIEHRIGGKILFKLDAGFVCCDLCICPRDDLILFPVCDMNYKYVKIYYLEL